MSWVNVERMRRYRTRLAPSRASAEETEWQEWQRLAVSHRNHPLSLEAALRQLDGEAFTAPTCEPRITVADALRNLAHVGVRLGTRRR